MRCVGRTRDRSTDRGIWRSRLLVTVGRRSTSARHFADLQAMRYGSERTYARFVPAADEATDLWRPRSGTTVYIQTVSADDFFRR